MSTKGLMSHKKVAEVTLHPADAGKNAGNAATLTLKEPWLFDGQRGPFTLENVEHGHRIVRGAYDPAKGPKEPKAPKSSSSAPEATSAGRYEPALDRTKFAKGKGFYVYRWKVEAPDLKHRIAGDDNERTGHEVTGWLRTNRPWTPAQVKERALNEARSSLKGPEDAYRASFKRWTVADETAARKANDSGSPWMIEHLEQGDGK